MIELLAYTVMGMLIGICLGLVPGMNINNLIPIFLSLSAFIDSTKLAVLVVSIAIAEILSNYIPSIFLGAPESDESLCVLPAHRMLLEGRGMEALKLILLSSLISFIFSLTLILIFSQYFIKLYDLTRPYIHYAILWTVIFLVLYGNTAKNAIKTALIFLLSGFWGLLVLNLRFLPSDKVMFPLLSGLFGLSTLLISLKEKSHLPQQSKDEKIKISKKKLLIGIVSGSIFGIVAGFLPAIGVSQTAIISQAFTGLTETRAFLVLVSSIVIANEIFSLSSLYLVSNPRSGASVALQKLVPNFDSNMFYLVIGSFAISFGFAAIVVWFISKVIYKKLVKIDYEKVNIFVILLLSFLVFVFTGISGLFVFFVSGALGFLTASIGVRRSTCMAVLLLPSFLFFSGLEPLILNAISL